MPKPLQLGFILAAAGLAASLSPGPTLASAQAAAVAGPQRHLRATADVQSAVIRVADLLAPGETLPAHVEQTVLAAAPQPGTPLLWRRAQLAARLRAAGIAPTAFAIPAQVVVSRSAWPVSPSAVLTALSQHFHRTVRPEEVSYTSPLTTASGDPGVVVERARLDVARGRLQVLCRASNDRRLLPFTVTLRMSPSELAGLRQTTPLPASAPAPPLVSPGHAAKLVIADKGFYLTTKVMPLEAGRAGQQVRAVSLATHAVIEVEVIGANQVRSITAVPEASHVAH